MVQRNASMINFEQMQSVLKALPDPAFILSRSGKYIEVFGGRDTRYYHDGTGLVGLYISDLIEPPKATWFLEQIARALDSRQLLIEEYELSNRDVKGLDDVGPKEPIWFEGRIQALDFLVDEEEVVLWVASNISKRHALENRLRELGDTDLLTGLFNRRKLEQDLAYHFEALLRYSVPTSVFMFDLDNLKKINDTMGHYAGDDTIKAVADICRTALRTTDIACRFGGDEFVVALPNTGQEQAIQLATRLHSRLRAGLRRFRVEDAVVTASIGVAMMKSEDASYEDAIKRADLALYEAKSRGKDRVVLA